MGNFKPTELQKEIIKRANIQGKIKNVIHFSYNDEKYSIIINRITRFPRLYAIRLVNYEDNECFDNSSSLSDKSKHGLFSSNKEVQEIKIKAAKRFPDLIGFYETKEQANQEAKNIEGNEKIIEQCIYEVETQEDEAENILLIGRTGSGKSTLANVLTNTDKFEVGAGLNSKTKNFESETFENLDQEGSKTKIKYRVVDTIGVGDTDMSPKKVMFKLAEAIHTMKKGIKRVFVVVGTRLTNEEIEAFKLAKKIFGVEIFDYTTVVRSNFVGFRDMEGNPDSKDKELLHNKIYFPMDIIYVNNPPLNKDERKQKIDEEDRKSSREVLLRYLNSDKCQGNYKLENWDNVCVRINDYMNAKKWKEDHEDTEGSLLSKNELLELKKEVVEEMKSHLIQSAEFQAKVEVPLFGNIQIAAKFKNCCSIV